MREHTYDAFICYRRADGSGHARALRRALLDFRFPGDYPDVPVRPLNIYLDRIYERATNDFFERTIKPALAQSAHLIVVRTPAALLPRSDGQPNWVEREIEYFRGLPQGENISVALAIGERNDPLPGRLGEQLPNIESIDIRHIRQPWNVAAGDAVVDFIATLHGVPDQRMPILRAEEAQRRSTRFRAVTAAATIIAVSFAALAVAALVSRGAARRAEGRATEQSRVAVEQSRLAVARQLAAESTLLRLQSPGQAGSSALLAIESYRRQPTAEGERALRAAAGLLVERVGSMAMTVGAGDDLVLRPDGKVAAALSRKGGIVFYDSRSDEGTGGLAITDYESIAFSSDSRWLAVLTSEGVVSVWDAEVLTHGSPLPERNPFGEDGSIEDAPAFDERLRQLRSAPGIHGVYLVPMGSRVVAVDRQGRVAVAGRAVYLAREAITDAGDAIDRHEQPVEALAFDGSGQRLAIASSDGEVRVLSVPQRRVVARLRHGAAVHDVAFNDDGSLLATASADSTARIWETAGAADYRERLRLPHESAVVDVELGPDGQNLLTRSAGGTVRLWDGEAGRELARLDQSGAGGAAIALRPGGHRAVTVSSDGVIRDWNLDTVAIENRRYRVARTAFAVGFVGDGSVAALVPGTKIALVDPRHGGIGPSVIRDPFAFGAPLNPGEAFMHSMERCSFTFASSDRYVACSEGGDLEVRRIADNVAIGYIPNAGPTSCAFAPDDSALAIADGSELGLLALPSLRPTPFIVQGIRPGSAVALSAGGRYVAAALDDHTAAVWRSLPGRLVQKVQTAGMVSSVALTQDGKYVAAADSGSRSVIIAAVGGGEVARLPHDDSVKAVAFDRSGRYVATATANGEVMVWMWRPADLVARVCALLPADVRVDWQRYLPGEPAPRPCGK